MRALPAILKKIIPRRFHPAFVIVSKTNNVVFSGPFAGMKFVFPEPVTKYLLGTYELELVPLIEELCGKHFDVVINIGAEFGYYAAGLALRMPRAKIIAFEAQQQLHYHIRRTAKDNGVDGRVSVRGSCDADLLSSAIPDDKKCLVVMDCEGGEFG